MKLLPSKGQPYLYLSGSGSIVKDKDEERWIKVTGCKYRMYSYAYAAPGAFLYTKAIKKSLELSQKLGCGIAIDSSAFTFHTWTRNLGGAVSNKKKSKVKDIGALREEVIEGYVAWCKEHEDEWDFYITFDYLRHCPTIRKVTKRLIKEGLWPVPVYHGDMELDWLQKYIDDGHKLIAVGTGGWRKNWKDQKFFFDQIFNVTERQGVKVHGLAIANPSMMYAFPWYSVDAATWAKSAAYGTILYVDPVGHVACQFHVSDRQQSKAVSFQLLPKSLQRQVEEVVDKQGFDMHKLATELKERATYNAYVLCTEMPKVKKQIEKGQVRWEKLV